ALRRGRAGGGGGAGGSRRDHRRHAGRPPAGGRAGRMSVQAPSRPPRAPVAAVGEPIRLLSFLDVFAPAGTEGQVVTLAQALDPARFALRFGCFERAGSLVPVVEALRMPITEYRIRRLYGLHTARAQWRLAREIRAQRIDIVHT